jgi:predicted dienelactone hydrolase
VENGEWKVERNVKLEMQSEKTQNYKLNARYYTMKALQFVYALNVWIACMASACILSAATPKDDAGEASFESQGKSVSIEREYSVASKEVQWFDAGRSRQAPVKIYYPSAGKGPFPVVLFSHGLGRTREDCAYLGTHWASRGYVSVFVEHAGSDEAVWRGKVQPKKHLKEAFDNPATMRNRPLDLQFALDQIERLKRDGDILALRMDLTRVGAAGFDMGAQTVLALAGQVLPGGIIEADPRISAVIAMSPPVPVGQVPLDIAYKDICVPCLFITGSEDNGIVGTTKAYQRRIPFDKISGADQYLAIFYGGDHLMYAGNLRQRESEKDARFQPYIRDAATLFWDAYLQEKPEAIVAMQGTGLSVILGSSASVEKKISSGENSHSARKAGKEFSAY